MILSARGSSRAQALINIEGVDFEQDNPGVSNDRKKPSLARVGRHRLQFAARYPTYGRSAIAISKAQLRRDKNLDLRRRPAGEVGDQALVVLRVSAHRLTCVYVIEIYLDATPSYERTHKG